jgi:hypothetical protein
MTDKDYHPDGFVRMNTGSFDEDVKAMERGIAFMQEVRGAGNPVPSGAGVVERDPMRPMGFADIQELFDVTLTEDPEGAERLIQLVRMIEEFHGIG